MKKWAVGALSASDSVSRSTWELTDEQEKFLDDNWRILGDKALAEMLGTTGQAVRKLRNRRGLIRQGRNACKPEKAEVPIILWILRNDYEKLDEAQIEINLGLGE